jgi:hypothetical protein
MTMTTADVTTITPLAHQEAMRLQAHELERALTLLRSLDQASWATATDCPAWDIRAMYQHGGWLWPVPAGQAINRCLDQDPSDRVRCTS